MITFPLKTAQQILTFFNLLIFYGLMTSEPQTAQVVNLLPKLASIEELPDSSLGEIPPRAPDLSQLLSQL